MKHVGLLIVVRGEDDKVGDVLERLLGARLVFLDFLRVIDLLVRFARIKVVVFLERELNDEIKVAELEILRKKRRRGARMSVKTTYCSVAVQLKLTELPSSFKYARLIFLDPTRTRTQFPRWLSSRIWSRMLEASNKDASSTASPVVVWLMPPCPIVPTRTHNSVFSRRSMLLYVST